ncbi:hypothetical protein A1O7_05710 [Cladophialophora yegresii CBS 114405]|uniref:Uncharacterized protein n=1 Tax=Cladophialophora yegresii CBS 114405 TaxID=1182544 RepID=W9VZY0_9EURO|nr:uncharacterized protein A1O7_05710 [Cladophialophora yegresii CBS 114405]EXJ58285.1 hypothetical protein A1O7_05710 [Cladophialophora yegresii CBS 114405]
MNKLTPSVAEGFSLISMAPNSTSASFVDFDHSILTAWGTSAAQLLTWSHAWKLFLLVVVLLNLKAFPLVYHLRILNGVRFVLRSQRHKPDIQPDQLFQPLVMSSRACQMEVDALGHKSNSTYFTDVDVARAHLISTVFGKGIDRIRGDTSPNLLTKRPRSNFTVALGAVSCTFRREIMPYEKYDMWTRVLSWDEKWLYVVTHFVSKGAQIEPKSISLYPRQQQKLPQDGHHNVNDDPFYAQQPYSPEKQLRSAKSPVVASALSKVVFKNGRITIPPHEMLKACDLLPVIGPADGGDEKQQSQSGGSSSETARLAEAIEAERQQGLRQAALLAGQIELDQEFHSDVALGRHYDGLGIEGVVATLAQLFKLSSYQLI